NPRHPPGLGRRRRITAKVERDERCLQLAVLGLESNCVTRPGGTPVYRVKNAWARTASDPECKIAPEPCPDETPGCSRRPSGSPTHQRRTGFGCVLIGAGKPRRVIGDRTESLPSRRLPPCCPPRSCRSVCRRHPRRAAVLRGRQPGRQLGG